MAICSAEGCNKEVGKRKFCKRHYDQMRLYGHTYNRTMLDKNEIIEYEDYAEIILYDRYSNEIARTIIDKDDIDKIKDIKWNYHKQEQYVRSSKFGPLHRYIMNCPNNMVIDHINRNRLDNRKENLRICTIQQNGVNRGLVSNNTSKFTGVSYDKHGNKKWVAILTYKNKKYKKRFINKSDAIRYRLLLEIFYNEDKYIAHYSLLESVLQNNLEYTLNDLFNTQSLEQLQEYINILFTDSLLEELGLL